MINFIWKISFTFSVILVNAVTLPAEVKIKIKPDHEDGIYKVSETAEWKIIVDDPDAEIASLQGTVLAGGLKQVQKEKIELVDHKTTIARSSDKPGTLLLKVEAMLKNGKTQTSLGGVVFNPFDIKVSQPAPADFDEFWNSKIKELNNIPVDATLTPIDTGDKAIEYYQITMNNIRGKKIYGQIAKPAGAKNLPAMLQVQWAGVYPLQKDWVKGRAKAGWLAMNIIAHDLPIDQTEDFYKQKAAKELNDYPGQGSEDRETSYFLPMFLSCYRAVDYLTTREDWNKKIMLVHGGSQGGYQTLVTAGLHTAVTAIAASVPAGCDHTGESVERAAGWPQWSSRTWQGKNKDKLLSTSRYFDAMNFVPKFKGKALVGIGLIDTTCPAEGCLATYNNLQCEKQIVIMPLADHKGDHKDYYVAFEKFINKIKSDDQSSKLDSGKAR